MMRPNGDSESDTPKKTTDTDDPKSNPSDSLSPWLTRITSWGASLAIIIGGIFPKLGSRGQIVAFSIAGLLGITWAFLTYRKKWRKVQSTYTEEVVSPTALLRGLLPFEDGDHLYGRAGDLQSLCTIIRSASFRFGVVWGQSGCGKTSLLRAGLLPALRNLKLRPIYLEKPSASPVNVIHSHLSKASSVAPQNDADATANIVAALKSSQERTVIVIDQFEELFLLDRANEPLAMLKRLMGLCSSDMSIPVSILVGIREDFFARLQHLAPEIADPTSTRTSYELANLRSDKAEDVLKQSLETDKTGFDLALIKELVSDLETDGLVRPSELQLVATHLKRRGITTANQYESVGRAKGILSSYIKDEIRRTGNEPVARLVLKMMCNENLRPNLRWISERQNLCLRWPARNWWLMRIQSVASSPI